MIEEEIEVLPVTRETQNFIRRGVQEGPEVLEPLEALEDTYVQPEEGTISFLVRKTGRWKEIEEETVESSEAVRKLIRAAAIVSADHAAEWDWDDDPVFVDRDQKIRVLPSDAGEWAAMAALCHTHRTNPETPPRSCTESRNPQSISRH